jgi:DNA-binding beta-propeller fold protein YncE
MPNFAIRLLLALGASASVGFASAAAPAPNYAIARQVVGPDGGWDYTSVDPATHRVYVAHNSVVTEIDVAHGDAVRSFGAIAKAHAVVPVPGRSLLLVTSGHDDSVRLLDTTDGHEVAKIAVGTDPDAAFYDPASGEAVVMNAKAGTVSVIDIVSLKVARTITLKPGLEFGVVGKDGTLFVNNEDLGEIETADLRSGKAGPVIAMPGCEGPTGLGFDARTDRLISACANGKAAVIDASIKHLSALLDIGRGPDAVIIDAARRFAFIPCGQDGLLEIVSLDAPGGAQVVGSVKTEIGARTGALDPSDGTLYLPTARFSPPATVGAKPAMIAGSFHVLVLNAK